MEKMPRVQYYTIGNNKWQTSEVWPHANAVMTELFLSSKGIANTLNVDGKLTAKNPRKDRPDTFKYDPMNPVMSYGGNVCCTGNTVAGGSFDQSEMALSSPNSLTHKPSLVGISTKAINLDFN